MLQFNNRQEYEKYLKKYSKKFMEVHKILINKNIMYELMEEMCEIRKAGFNLYLREVLAELNIKEPADE